MYRVIHDRFRPVPDTCVNGFSVHHGTRRSPRRRSELEIYLDILRALAERPLKVTQITCRTSVNWNTARDAISFLENRDLVVSRKQNDEIVYAITSRCLDLLEHLKRIEEIFGDMSRQATLPHSR